MGYLPICVDMAGARCLVVGGGEVAERKVGMLLDLGACVKVISPRLTSGLELRAKERSIEYCGRPYRDADLVDQRFVFVATNDTEVNRAVATVARQRGIWVNAADDPANCDFILPAVVRRGDLVVAVSTGGGSPAIARMIREELEERVSEDYGTMLECVAEVRRVLRRRSLSPGAGAWRRALDSEFRDLVASRDLARARAYLVDRLRGDQCAKEK